MKNLLVCSCVADDRYAPVSAYLMKHRLADVVSGIEQYAADNGAEVLYLLPEGEEVNGLEGQVRHSAASPVLGNPYAVAQVLSGNLPRPMICEDYVAVYKDKAVMVLTPEAAYEIRMGTDTRFVAVNAGGKTRIEEVKIGTPLCEIADVQDAGYILLGGLQGEFVTPQAFLEHKVSADSLYSSVTVYGKEACIVDICKKLTEEAYESSCGKCVLCREGTSQFKQIVAEMTTGKAKPTDIAMIKETGRLICVGSYCPFGQNMPRPLLSAIELYPEEFDAHIRKKICKCGICYQEESTYVILPDKCTGCGECMDVCEECAIEGKDGYIHMIDQDMCEQCGKCVSACEERAIMAVSGKLPRLPKKLTKVGRF